MIMLSDDDADSLPCSFGAFSENAEESFPKPLGHSGKTSRAFPYLGPGRIGDDQLVSGRYRRERLQYG